jgi:hypothetical protein
MKFSLPYSKRAEEIEAHRDQNDSCHKSDRTVRFLNPIADLPIVTPSMSAARGRLKPTA